MDLIKLLRSQGFGSRSDAKYLIENELVRINGELQLDPKKNFKEPFGLAMDVDGEAFTSSEHVYIAMHKPLNHETSHRPQHHESVFSLLPGRFLARNVQAVGRLDVDTTGLLLFSDDGQFIHRVSSGNKHCVKTYEITAKHPINDEWLRRLTDGVMLHDDHEEVRALTCTALDAHRFVMQIDSGKYHQVKRMVAAAGNRVDALHRIGVGLFALPHDLEQGQWRHLTDDEIALCLSQGGAKTIEKTSH
jgi:16S rRNA pseudouridine516 synthase